MHQGGLSQTLRHRGPTIAQTAARRNVRSLQQFTPDVRKGGEGQLVSAIKQAVDLHAATTEPRGNRRNTLASRFA